MTTWFSEWRTLDERVDGLQRTLMDFVGSVEHSQQSTYNDIASETFLPALRSTFEMIRQFAVSYQRVLPGSAMSRLNGWLATSDTRISQVSGLRGATIVATMLSTFCAEILPLLTEGDAQRVQIADRAFLHLQRLIVVDPDIRAKWRRGFAAGEVECERLGGVHLLHHGIYAVKSNAAGERTDLILGTRFALTSKVQRSADAMALTEWKLVRDDTTLDDAVTQARSQATRYAAGSLAGFEISSMRFLVTVSEDVIDEKPDELIGSVTYRHVNIAVSPSSPSRS